MSATNSNAVWKIIRTCIVKCNREKDKENMGKC